MHSDDTEYTDLGMSVIKDLAPQVHDAIAGDETWQVHVVDSPDQLDGTKVEPAKGALFFGNAYGATWTGGPITQRDTWLPRPVIKAMSELVGAAESHVIAEALVHEYMHHRFAAGEADAYASALALDRLMGDSTLIANAEAGFMMSVLGY